MAKKKSTPKPTNTIPSSLYDDIQAQQGRAYVVQGILQVVRRRLEILQGDEMELCHVRSSLAAAEEIAESMGSQLDHIEGSLREVAMGVTS
jgi:hypothetical protein